MRHDKASMNWQRKVLALMGFLLPILSVFTGFIAYDRNGSEFWHSISATFYASSNIFMIGCLSIFAFFLWTYKGYDIGDSVSCKFSALMCLGILVFPCKCPAAGVTTGVLNFPTEISHIIHCIIAGLLFGSFAYMIGWRFTKTSGYMTKKKYKRNELYIVCGLLIAFAMALQVMTSLKGITWMTIVNETIMLWAFSLAWLVKADGVRRLNDIYTENNGSK